MLAWSEGLITRRRNQKSPFSVIADWSYLQLLRSPRRACHAKPKTLINRRPRPLPASFPLVGCHHKQLGLKDFSPKSQDAVALQQIKGVALYLWLIVVISVRQSTVAAISGLPCGRTIYGQFEHKADSLIFKIQRSGRNGQRDWCMSRVAAIISALKIPPVIVCLSWAVNHYRDNAITYKAQQTKMPENWSWRTRQCGMQMRQRDVAALDAKYTKG